MSEDNTQVPQDSSENSNSADSFFAPEATSESSSTTSSRNKWVMPGAAIAGAALLSGLLGFSIGSHNGPDFRQAAEAGQMTPGQGGPGQGGPGMDGDHDGGMNDNHKGRGMHGQPGPGMPGMLPGGPQGGIDFPPTTPHCHDATGADTEVGVDGLCADGSQPGVRGFGNQPGAPIPVPSASSSTSIQ